MDLNRDRFAALAEAYGGDIARWPEADRDGGAQLLSADADFARKTLAAAGRLDAVLDEWRPLAVGFELREAVNGAAPRARRRPTWYAWAVRAGLGAALTGACAGGVLVGAAAWGGAEPSADVITAVMSADLVGVEVGDVG